MRTASSSLSDTRYRTAAHTPVSPGRSERRARGGVKGEGRGRSDATVRGSDDVRWACVCGRAAASCPLHPPTSREEHPGYSEYLPTSGNPTDLNPAGAQSALNPKNPPALNPKPPHLPPPLGEQLRGFQGPGTAFGADQALQHAWKCGEYSEGETVAAPSQACSPSITTVQPGAHPVLCEAATSPTHNE